MLDIMSDIVGAARATRVTVTVEIQQVWISQLKKNEFCICGMGAVYKRSQVKVGRSWFTVVDDNVILKLALRSDIQKKPR